MIGLVGSALTGTLLLAACGQGSSVGAVPGSTQSTGSRSLPPGPVSRSPQDLVGLWRLQADGEEPGTVLRIADDLSIWRRCSEEWGGWAASPSGGFVAYLSSYSYACGGPKPSVAPKPEEPPMPSPPGWLLHATGYRVQGADRILVDSTGRTVARLSPGGKPFPNPHVIAELSAAPTPDTRPGAGWHEPAPLPAGLKPPTAAQLIGTWYLRSSRPRPGTSASATPGAPTALASRPARAVFITFTADGGWKGSDGCNVTTGRWLLGSAGLVLSASGGTTRIGCFGQGEVPRLYEAARIGLDGSVLVYVDVKGRDIGRWSRTP